MKHHGMIEQWIDVMMDSSLNQHTAYFTCLCRAYDVSLSLASELQYCHVERNSADTAEELHVVP